MNKKNERRISTSFIVTLLFICGYAGYLFFTSEIQVDVGEAFVLEYMYKDAGQVCSGTWLAPPEYFQLKLKPGEGERICLKVTNTANATLDYNVTVNETSEQLKISINDIHSPLKPFGFDVCWVDIGILKKAKPGNYKIPIEISRG